MATIQLGTTKSANRLISYAEKRAEEREGVNCPSEYAKSQMNATRQIWGKTDGIQAHHVIQSFKPGEVTPQQANEIGQELAKEVAKGHEAVVYTHTDKDHIHNHIVINSVNYENGSKYQAHGKEAIERVRAASDQLCKERGLSVVKEPYAKERSHLAEHGLAEKGIMSWKQEIRTAINYEKQASKSFEELKENLTKNYDIQVKERGKHITFTHPNGMKVRGATLGNDYDKEMLKREFTREIESERKPNQERGNSNLSNEQFKGSERNESGTTHEIESNRELSVSASEGKHNERDSDRDRAEANPRSQSEVATGNDLNYDELHKRFEERKRGLQGGYKQQYYNTHENDRSSESSPTKQQRADSKGLAREQDNNPEQADRNREEQQKQRERVAEQDHEHDFER